MQREGTARRGSRWILQVLGLVSLLALIYVCLDVTFHVATGLYGPPKGPGEFGDPALKMGSDLYS